MVELVSPLFQREVARSFGGPQPGLAPLGEGAGGQSILDMAVSGGAGNAALAGGASPLASTAGGGAPSVSGGSPGGGFLENLGRNPLFLAGMTGLAGGNPFQALQAQQAQQARQQQAQQNFEFKRRAEQRTIADRQAAAQEAEQEQGNFRKRQELYASTLENLPADFKNRAAAEVLAASDDAPGFAAILQAKDVWKPLTDADRKEIGLPAGAPGLKNTETGDVDLLKPPTAGISVRGPDGTLIQVGGPAGQQRGPVPVFGATPTVNKISAAAFDAVEQLSQLNQIKKSFRPEFQEFAARGKFEALRLAEKAGTTLDPTDRAFVRDFATARQDSVQNLNATIRAITGATINKDEVPRIEAGIPNAGTGIFDGDSATQFETKLDNSIRQLRRSFMRYNYALNRGLDPLATGIELADVDQLVRRREDELLADIRARNPGFDEEAVRNAARDRLKREFGL